MIDDRELLESVEGDKRAVFVMAELEQLTPAEIAHVGDCVAFDDVRFGFNSLAP